MLTPNHPKLFDAFISYSRVDSKMFVLKLHQRLLQQGLKIWVDQHDIPPAVDWQEQIKDGIARSRNFIFVIAPHAVASKYCLEELEIAVRFKKRIIPLLHVRVERDQRPAELRRLNWIYCQEERDDVEAAFAKLLASMQQEADYVQQHTLFLVEALTWLRHQKRLDYLLIGEERQQAEAWLRRKFDHDQPPCEPTDLHAEYICESTKNANNFLTNVFVSYASPDREVMLKLRSRIMREGFTIWSDRSDLRTGKAFQAAIDQGIEGADNLVYLLSQHSLASPYCQAELAYAQQLHKRIIPIRLEPVDSQKTPVEIQGMQFIDAQDCQNSADYQATVDQLLKILHEDSFYYLQSKNLLVKALKWERQNQNPSILLRGHNLQHYAAWFRVAQSHQHHQPLPIQQKFLDASQKHPPEPSLDVFISYSRADSDFARRLNETLQFQGKTTWFDQESIPSGSNYREEICRGIEASDNFLFIISPRSIQSPYCDDEVEYARSLGKRLLTVLYQPVKTQAIPAGLASIQWVDFTRDGGDFYTKFSELTRNLDVDREHVKNHTKWLLRAQEWRERGKSADLLLRGNEFAIATAWLQTAQQENKQPPVTALQQELMHKSEQAITAAEKREKRRLLVLRSLLGVVSSALIIAVGLGIEAYREFRRATLKEIEATSRSAEALFASDQQLDALVEILNAKQKLVDLRLEGSPLARNVDETLSKIVYRIVEYNRLTGHRQEVFDVALHPDNRLIATASGDKTIKLWRPDGTLIDTLASHTGPVWSVVFSPDGETMLSGSADRTIKIWQAPPQTDTYQLVSTFDAHQATVYDLQFHPNGQYFASGGGDSLVKIWDLAQRQVVATLEGHTNEIYTVEFSDDGRWLATGGGDGLIKLWQRERDRTFVEKRTITGHQGWISEVAFSPDDQLLASASSDHTLKLWQVEDGTLVNTLSGHNDVVWSVSWTQSGQMLLSGSWDRTLRLWNRQGVLLDTVEGHQQRVRDLVIGQDNGLMVSASADETVKIWRASKALLTVFRSHAAGLLDVDAQGDLIATASDDKTVKLWHRESWREIHVDPLVTLTGHENGVLGVAISPDAEFIVSGSWDHTLKVWQPDGTLLTTLTGHQVPITEVAISPDGQFIASAGLEGTIKLWAVDRQNPRNIKLLETLPAHRDRVHDVAFSPDGRYLVSSSEDETIKVWSLITDSGQLQVNDPIILSGHTAGVRAVAFSPDSQYLASASDDQTVRLWRMQSLTGSQITLEKVLSGHLQEVQAVVFHPQQPLLVSGSTDETIKVWHADEGTLLTTLNGHEAAVTGLAFSADGQLLSSSRDRTLIAWNLAEVLSEHRILADGCAWISEYLEHNPQVSSEALPICQTLMTEETARR